MSEDEFEIPDNEGEGEGEGQGEFSDQAHQAVFVTTREPVSVAIGKLDDPRAPESTALAAYIGGRLVARSAMPDEAIQRLIDLNLFEEPVPLGLFAYEEDPGLQCRLFALVPRDLVEDETHSDEPWKASVPSYEASVGSDEEDDEDEEEDGLAGTPFQTILLGHIVRFMKDRRHPDSLADEAIDILQRIIHGAEPLEDADRKAIDDLLDSL